MPEGVNDCVFLFLWRLRRSAVFVLRKIIVDALYDTASPLCLRYIQMCHMKPVLFLHPFLDLFVCSLALHAGQIQFIHIQLDADMMPGFREFGQ